MGLRMYKLLCGKHYWFQNPNFTRSQKCRFEMLHSEYGTEFGKSADCRILTPTVTHSWQHSSLLTKRPTIHKLCYSNSRVTSLMCDSRLSAIVSGQCDGKKSDLGHVVLALVVTMDTAETVLTLFNLQQTASSLRRTNSLCRADPPKYLAITMVV